MMTEAKLDKLERIHIPKKFMEVLNWEIGQKLMLTLTGDKLIITPKMLDQQCPVCKHEFTSEYSFCPYCGQYLETKTKED